MDAALRARLQTDAMEGWLHAAPLAERVRLDRRLRAALSALLDLRPAPRAPGDAPTWGDDLAQARDGSYGDLLAARSAWLGAALSDPAYPHAAAPTAALCRALATLREPEARLPSLVHDLAEILALPREARSEYRHHHLPGQPWRIRKLLLEYGVKALALDVLVAALNRRFCAERCPDPPVGCCHILGYDLGLVPEAMLELQALEAAWRASTAPGWAPLPEGAVERKCRYHTDRGCVLVRWKSPACIGALCTALQAHLPSAHPPERLDPLLTALADFRRSDLDRRAVFEAMDALLAAGAPLLGAALPAWV